MGGYGGCAGFGRGRGSAYRGCNIGCLVLPFISMSRNSLTGMSAAAKGRGGSTGFDKGRFGLRGGGIRIDRGGGSWFGGDCNFGLLAPPYGPYISMSKKSLVAGNSTAAGDCGSGFCCSIGW